MTSSVFILTLLGFISPRFMNTPHKSILLQLLQYSVQKS